MTSVQLTIFRRRSLRSRFGLVPSCLLRTISQSQKFCKQMKLVTLLTSEFLRVRMHLDALKRTFSPRLSSRTPTQSTGPCNLQAEAELSSVEPRSGSSRVVPRLLSCSHPKNVAESTQYVRR